MIQQRVCLHKTVCLASLCAILTWEEVGWLLINYIDPPTLTLLNMDASSEESESDELYRTPDDDFLLIETAETPQKQSLKSRKCKKTSEKGKRRQRHTLTKKEIGQAIKYVHSIPYGEMMEHVKRRLEECPIDEAKLVIEVLVKDEKLFKVLILHHQTTFLALYTTEPKKGQDKFMQFQIEWYNHCSIFLAPKSLNIKSIISDPSEETCSTKLLWQNFCESSSLPLQHCHNVMIQLSSIIYDYLLRKVQTFTAMLMPSNSSSPVQVKIDDDDVYYRFGGSIIAEMLKVRYKGIKKCSESRRCSISEEITILQAINTKDKTSMPDYLKYRDEGHLYCPQSAFISFFRDIDKCVREVVNEVGLKEYRDDIVEVRTM